MNKPIHLSDFNDNPEWTDTDFARAKLASELLPADIAAALTKHTGSGQEDVTLELDRDVLAKFRATGGDWQKRINDVLRAATL